MENYENNHEEYEVSLNDILKTFMRGLWIMVAAALVLGTLAFGYSKFFIPRKYTTNVKLYVETQKHTDSSYASINDRNYATALVDTYIEMLSTNNFYEKLSDNLDNKYTAAELSKMVSFISDDDTRTEVFRSIITAKSPTDAKVIADSVADTAPTVISSLNDNTELKIVDNAVIPSEPSSPNVMKNTLLAAIAGFALALIFVYVREALDNKIKYSAELTNIDGIPVLSAIPDFGDENFKLWEKEELTEGEVNNG
ncbi:MAG: hypothetical protein J1E41_04040 [Ruminococcus sp.]|nr:hypothetical protein [Ruminococcus sp.]